MCGCRELEEALEGLVGWFEENDDRASDFGELFEVVAGRSALARYREATKEKGE